MAKAFAVHHSMTDHGGVIPATQIKATQMGIPFLVAGDGYFCARCSQWSTIIKSHDHVIFDGKAVAYVGDKLSCGATILPKQVHVVGESGNPEVLVRSVSMYQQAKINLNNNVRDGNKQNKVYKIYTITKSLAALKMADTEAEKLGNAHLLSEDKFYIYRRNKGLSIVSEETLKRINGEIPIYNQYLKQGFLVIKKLSDQYYPYFENNVYLEFCDQLFTNTLQKTKDRKTAKRTIDEIKAVYGVNVVDSVPETYALYHVYEALVPQTSKGYGYDKIQHFIYNVYSQFNKGYLPTKITQLGAEAVDIFKGKASKEILMDSGHDMEANNAGSAYGAKLAARYDESILFRDKK